MQIVSEQLLITEIERRCSQFWMNVNVFLRFWRLSAVLKRHSCVLVLVVVWQVLRICTKPSYSSRGDQRIPFRWQWHLVGWIFCWKLLKILVQISPPAYIMLEHKEPFSLLCLTKFLSWRAGAASNEENYSQDTNFLSEETFQLKQWTQLSLRINLFKTEIKAKNNPKHLKAAFLISKYLKEVHSLCRICIWSEFKKSKNIVPCSPVLK